MLRYRRGTVSVRGGVFQLEGWCVSEIGGGVFVFEHMHKKWRGCVSNGGGACIKWGAFNDAHIIYACA